MTTSEAPIGSDDIVRLNQRMVARAGAFARLAGTALIVVGAVGVAAWVWIAVRQQWTGFGGSLVQVSLTKRIDAFAATIGVLIYSSIAAVGGCAVRLIADYTVARTGGSLTGFMVGDPVAAGGPVAVVEVPGPLPTTDPAE